MRPLRITLTIIGTVQLVLGFLFLVPDLGAALLGLDPAPPGWASWLLVMLAARFLGYGAGLLAAARDPQRHLAWVDTMIVVQVIDWVATIAFLYSGGVSLSQVGTAAFLPVVFTAALLWWHPRRLRTAGGAAAAELMPEPTARPAG